MNFLLDCVVFGLWAFYRFGQEIFFRTDKSVTNTQADRNTFRIIVLNEIIIWTLTFLIRADVLPIFPIFHTTEISGLIYAFAIGLGVGAIWLRKVSMDTLGKHFTRTLQVKENQKIRHPGYTTVLMIFLGGPGVLSQNTLFAFLLIIDFVVIYHVRTEAEEKMMEEAMPDYVFYKKKTKKFIPFLY